VPEADKPLTRRLDESGAAALPNVDLPSKKNAAHIEMLVLHPTRPAIRLRAARNLAAKLRHAALLLGQAWRHSPSRLALHPLQRQLADEVGQPRNEGLVDFQVERRLRELLAIAYEHATLTDERDGGARDVPV